MADLLDFIMRWAIVPAAAFIWRLWSEVTFHKTEIALLRQRLDTATAQRSEDAAALREVLGRINTKLDKIDDRINEALK